MSSPTVPVANTVAVGLGTVTDTNVAGGSLAGSAVTVNWGDGHSDTSATVSPVASGSTTYSITENHNYAKAGTYTVTVTDSDGHAVVSVATAVNVTPTVPASGIAFNLSSSSVPTSTSASGTAVSLGTFTDTNVAAGDLSNTSVSIDWGDGSVTAGTAVATVPPSSTYYIFGGTAVGNSQVHNYAKAGPYTVTVTVDDGVHSDSASTTITAVVPATPDGITFNLSSPTIALSNSAVIGLGTVTDTNVAGGALTNSAVTVAWGDGHSDSNATVSPVAAGFSTYSISDSHTYAHSGSYSLTVTVNDGVHSDSTSTTIHVVTLTSNAVNFNLVSPEVPVSSSSSGTLGAFSDTNAGGYTAATVDWGDGTQSTATVTALPNLPDSYTVGLNHQYQTFGTFTATVQVTDGTGTYAASTPVTVYSTALSVTPSPVSGSPGSSVPLTATLSDPGSTLGSDQYQATVDWGDGTSNDPDVTPATVSGGNGAYTINASHTYSTAGTFTVRVAATRAGSLPDSVTSAYTAALIARVITPTNWMQTLADSLPLTDISIPGTHQSAAGGTLLTVLTGDQNLLQKAQDADNRALYADVAAFIADAGALASGELAPPVEFAVAALDGAAATLDALSAKAWSDYANSLGNDAYPHLKTEAQALAGFAGSSATLNGISVGLHVASALADSAAEGEAELDPIADAVQVAADTASASDDTAKLADRATFFVGGVFDVDGFALGKKFDSDLLDAQNQAAQLQTQTLSIADQLNSGIRSLDIRGALVNDTIDVNNGSQNTGVTLRDVLNASTAFLQAHPSETIVMSLRSNENAPVNSTNSFTTDLSNLLAASDAAVSGTHTYNDFVYSSSTPTNTPDLGQVRGKIVIIPYAPDPSSVQSGSGFGWQPTTVDEAPTDVSDPVTVWNDAEGQNQTAGLIPTDLGNPNTLYINNLASNYPGTPPIGEAAAVNPIAEQLFGSALLAPSDPNYFHVARTAGIVGMDNPGQTLVDDVIGENNLPIIVTSDADSGVGSLRAAITQANSQPGVNTIEFSDSMTGPSGQLIVLQSDLPAITNDVVVIGSVYIEANGHQVFTNSAQHTVTEIDFIASASGTTPTPISPSPSVPLYVNISGLTVFDHVAFATGPQTLVAGVVSGPIGLQLQDAQNDPVAVTAGAPALVVGLATTSAPTQYTHAEFRDASGISAPIPSVSFTAGNSTTPLFTYYDEKRGAPTLTASVGTVPVATQTEKVNANVPVQIYFYRQPSSGHANTAISPSVQMIDQFHNFVAFVPVTLRLNPVSVPAMRTGSIPVLRGPHTVKTPDTLDALASFPTASVNLPGVYTLTASIKVNGKTLRVTSKPFTITANPATVKGKVR